MQRNITRWTLAAAEAVAFLVLCSCGTMGPPAFTAPESSYKSENMQLADSGGTSVPIARVSPPFFGTPPLQPFLGRNFTAEEYSGQSPVVILNHAYWSARFRADHAVVATKLQMNGKLYTIIGVMPPEVETPKGIAGWIPGLV